MLFVKEVTADRYCFLKSCLIDSIDDLSFLNLFAS